MNKIILAVSILIATLSYVNCGGSPTTTTTRYTPPATTTKPFTLVRLLNGDGTSVISMSSTGGLYRWIKDPNDGYQLWRMVTNSDGTVTFINHANPTKVIDNEARLVVKTKPYYDSANQHWTRTGTKLKNVGTNVYLCYVKGNPEITNCFDYNATVGNNNWTIQNA